MRTRGAAGRIVALQLLLAAPLMVGGRLALDVRFLPDGQPHVEVKHGAGCPTAHDHKLCTLVHQTVWLPASPTPRITHRQSSVSDAPSAAGNAHDDGLCRLRWARGPPASA